MTQDLQQLIDILSLTQVDKGLYEGINVPFTRNHIFGGQLLAQTIQAGLSEVPADRSIHSCHAYFLKMGDKDQKLTFKVEAIRDGRSFSVRRVSVLQKDTLLFENTMSFTVPEPGPSHQEEMPPFPQPEELEDEYERWNAHPVIEAAPERKVTFRPVELRHTGPVDWFDTSIESHKTGVWVRARGSLPEDRNLHKVMLGYFSDMMLYGASLRPHGLNFHSPQMVAGASLDQVIWFHDDDFRADDWLFFQQDGIWSGNARGLNHGKFYTRDGRHIASASQEGLIRIKAFRV